MNEYATKDNKMSQQKYPHTPTLQVYISDTVAT